MASVSHRDPDGLIPDGVTHFLGTGSPENVIEAPVGSMFRRLDGTPGATLYVKDSGGDGNTGWTAVASYADATALAARVTAAESDIDALQAANTALDTRIDTVEADVATLETDFATLDGIVAGALSDIVVLDGRADGLETAIADLEADVISGDASLDGRLDAVEANGWVTQARIGANEVTVSKLSDMAQGTLLGRSTSGIGDPEGVSLGGSLELPAGGLLRRAALTGDVTAAADNNATTIANNAITTAKILDANVTLAKIANIATARFLGRTTAGSGVVEELTATQATAMLNAVTTSAKGLVPTAPDVATQFLNGTGVWSVPKQRIFFVYAVDVVTAGTTGRFLNTVGFTTTPAGTTAYAYPIPVAGYLISTRYVVAAVHTTNTVVVTPRLSGADKTDQALTMATGVQASHVVHATPLAVTPGTGTSLGDYLACRIDHNGATNLTRCFVYFEIEY